MRHLCLRLILLALPTASLRLGKANQTRRRRLLLWARLALPWVHPCNLALSLPRRRLILSKLTLPGLELGLLQAPALGLAVGQELLPALVLVPAAGLLLAPTPTLALAVGLSLGARRERLLALGLVATSNPHRRPSNNESKPAGVR